MGLKAYVCIQCGRKSRNRKYCSAFCIEQAGIESVYATRMIQKVREWKFGAVEYTGTIPDFIRNYLLAASSNECSQCGWGEVNASLGYSPLEIDHVDGDATNNTFNNLKVLCPNCHSLTETYKSLNRGNSTRRK